MTVKWIWFENGECAWINGNPYVVSKSRIAVRSDKIDSVLELHKDEPNWCEIYVGGQSFIVNIRPSDMVSILQGLQDDVPLEEMGFMEEGE